MTTSSNPRASLLSGLRTGGVRSVSTPHPHSALPTTTTFSIPQQRQQYHHRQDADLADLVNGLHINQNHNGASPPPPSSLNFAAEALYAQQQQFLMAQVGFGNGMSLEQVQAMQMQLEIMRLQVLYSFLLSSRSSSHSFYQALKQQQLQQAQLFLQSQQQQSFSPQQSYQRTMPASAGPLQTAFPRLNPNAASFVGGGGRSASFSIPVTEEPEEDEEQFVTHRNHNNGHGNGIAAPSNSPATPNYHTTVISGGTPLSNGNVPQSKSDSAVSWRRATLPTLPSVTVSKPTESTTTSSTGSRSRSRTPSPPISPTTTTMREQASRKLYESLSHSRPSPTPAAQNVVTIKPPMRQPIGPPSSSVDELGTKNFARRIRRGALGVLKDARIGRERVLSFAGGERGAEKGVEVY
jgi:hypothetical protein